jgi:TonB-dependent receptor
MRFRRPPAVRCRKTHPLGVCLLVLGGPLSFSVGFADSAGDAAAAGANASASTSSSALEQVEILGQFTPEETARKAQQEAPNLVNIETYQEIKKLPDVSAAEAVRRIPGISMETDEGEGRYINIRGLDADLNSTTFGGLRLPPTNNASPFGGYRAVTLDSIPIGLVGAITLTKSNLPSMDAEALGGTIEITPKTAPLNGAPFVEGHAGGGYEPLRRTPVIDLSVSGGTRFGGPGRPAGASTSAYSDHPFSVVASVTYYEDKRGIDDVEPAYFNDSAHPYFAFNNLQQRDYELNRKRHGYGIDLGFQPDADNNWYIRAFEAGYKERYWRQFLNLNPDGNTTLAADGMITDTLATGNSGNFPVQMALRDERESSKDQVAVAGGKNVIGGNTLSYRVGYTKGSWYKPYDYNSFFSYTGSLANARISYCPCGLGHTPLYTMSGVDYLNPALYALSGFSNSSAYNFDKEKSVAVDLLVPVHWVGFDSESVQVGASARLRNKRTTDQPTSYATLPNLNLASIAYTGPEVYYQGQYHNPPDIPPYYLQNLLGPGTIAGTDAGSALQQFLDAREDVYAAYMQYEMKRGPLGILAGVRVEGTRDSSDAFLVQTTNGTPNLDAHGNPIFTPIHASHAYNDVFPGIQARYEIDADFIARAAWSTTLARPGFNQANPSETVDLGSGIVSFGNQNLRAATANGFDLSLERYLPHAGIVSFGLFDKEIKNYIVGRETGTETLFGVPLRILTYINSGNSYARGAEFNYRQKFDMLPGLLGGLGAGGNYTYVDSRFEIRPGEHARLPSNSKNTWNATIFYENYGLTLKLAAYYVSADLFAIGTDPTADVYNGSRTFLDFGATYSLDPHWSLYFDAKNLVNTPHEFYQGSSDRPIQREFYRQTYLAGVRISFGG